MKTRTKLFICLLLVAPATLFGQVAIPLKPVEFNSEADTMKVMGPCSLQYLPETETKLSFKQVTNHSFITRFSDVGTIEKGATRTSTFWLRYRVQNNLDYPLEISIPERQARADVYISTDTAHWKHFVTGFDIPWSRRDGLKKIVNITYTIPAHSIINVYERDEGIKPQELLTTGFPLYTASSIIKQSYNNNDDQQTGLDLFNATIYGFFLFAALVSFFFYYVVREKEYLFYGIAVLLNAIALSPYTIFLIKEIPRSYSYPFRNATYLISWSAFLYSITLFLRIPKHHPFWNRVYLISLTLFTAIIALNNYGKYITAIAFDSYSAPLNVVLNISIGLVNLQIIVIIAIDLLKKRREAQLFMLAILPYLSMSLYSNISGLYGKTVIFKYGVLTLVWALAVISWILFDRFKTLQSENARQLLEREEERNRLISQQKEELEIQVANRTAELNQSLNNLKAAQNQLIQSEKMASLGELTAGIAHEIQNPLNFVNNFSEVNAELIDEMQQEIEKGDYEEVKAIAGDIRDNQQKISQHGKRADFIVKGMLQHSRTSTGERQLTNINILADEFLKLSYHGLRAKDKSFNAELATNFDDTLPKVNVSQQDIGRVLLNLFNNAFYAVNKKKQIRGADYKPEVTVLTSMENNMVIIQIKDNGIGIPEAIKDKIMQPFFTTKPTGEGTGLGLSLSYDIVAKGHGGSIAVETKENEFTAFTISIPFV